MTRALDFSAWREGDLARWRAAAGPLDALDKEAPWGARLCALATAGDLPAARPPWPAPGFRTAEAITPADAPAPGVDVVHLIARGDVVEAARAIDGALAIDGSAEIAREVAAAIGRPVDCLRDPRGDPDLGPPGAIRAVGDARIWFDAGATIDVALGCALASMVASLRAGAASTAEIGLIVPLDADLLAGIAAMRAARLCCAKIARAASIACETPILAAASMRDFSPFDPANDHLRLMAAVMAGAIGGAERVIVGPIADPVWRRIARNALFLARDEAHFGKVADPAAGAYWFERATASLAEAAWRRLQSIEAAGGLRAAIEANLIRHWVEEGAAARKAAIEAGDRAMVGVNAFRAANERRAAVVEKGPGPFARQHIRAEERP